MIHLVFLNPGTLGERCQTDRERFLGLGPGQQISVARKR